MSDDVAVRELSTVCVRDVDGNVAEDLDWTVVPAERLLAASPWRTFRWVDGQRHYSGLYWAATTFGHVIYESRLELTRLLYADSDPAITGVVAQPFLMRTRIDGVRRQHVPDFLMATLDGPIVVDVKPRRLLSVPKAKSTLDWTAAAVQGRGWRYQVWSEPPPVELANVRFLAGYRRAWLFDERLVAEITAADLDGVSIGEAVSSFGGWPRPLVKAALLHLLWVRVLATDLDVVLSESHRLRSHR